MMVARKKMIGEARSATLWCTDGGSDKEYRIHLTATGDAWDVSYENGRRGRALQGGNKTSTPVPFAQAEKIFDKILREKIAKGYTQQADGKRFAGTTFEARDSGLAPMLPSPIDLADLELLLSDNAWIGQPKFDGENRIVVITTENITGVNRKGLFTPIPVTWDTVGSGASPGRTVICGEQVGDRLVAFDIIEHCGIDLRSRSYDDRHVYLVNACAFILWIDVAPYAHGRTAKTAMLRQIELAHGEGIVFKRLFTPFETGRSSHSLKYKFEETATFIVTATNEQRSVKLGLIGPNGRIEDLGSVTIPANRSIPDVGELVEASFMYRFEDGALMQPKFLGSRGDIDRADCVTSQIRRIKHREPVAA